MISTIERTSAPSSMVSLGLAFSIPFVLGGYWIVYWLKQDLATMFLRPSVLAFSVLLAILWYQRPATIAERRLLSVLAIFCTVLLVPSLTASNPVRAVADWVKVSVMCVMCMLWTRALRDQSTSKMFGKSLIFAAIMLTVLIVVVYVRYMGMVLPTYQSTRGLKGVTQGSIPLNAVPFAAILAYLSGLCLLRSGKFLWSLGLVVCAIATVFTGSRTPAAIVGAGAGILVVILAVRSHRLPTRVAGLICILACLTATIGYYESMPYSKLIKLSEGRVELWRVAWDKFLERPMVGNGFDSWDDDLVSKLPDQYHMASSIAMNTAGGGYHNEYMTMLAEQGIVGTIPALYFFGFFFYTCWKLAFRRSSTWLYSNWALFGCLVILLRACVEVPGLFGYGGQEPADYLCFLFVSIAVSRLSIEEDFLRSNMQQVTQTTVAREVPRSGFRSSDKGIAHIS